MARNEMTRWRVPGLAISVVRDGEVMALMAYGFRDPDLTLEVTPSTNFGLASMTKSFTALIAGLMVQDGTIGWDTPIHSRVPAFQLADPELTARVTLRDLLSHRTGLSQKDSLWTSGDLFAEEIFDHLDELDATAPLGTHFEYNNVLYIGAAELISMIGGRPWHRVGRERILDPLGMTTSGFSVEELLESAEFSLSFGEREGALVANDFPGPEHRSWFFPRGSGSMFSNADDMARWMLFQLGDGVYDGKRVVSRDILRETHRSQIVLDDPPFYLGYPEVRDHGYAMGWYVDTYRGHLRWHHGGASMGYSNYIVLFPEHQIGVTILSNRQVLMPVELVYRVSDLLLGIEDADWAERFAEYVN